MLSFKSKRPGAELNASSMADIAFLLLVFFLVTTTIDIEKGITVKLPSFEDVEPSDVNQRNIFSIHLNFQNKLLVENKEVTVEQLREMTKEFILNPAGKTNLAEQPNMAVLSLRNDRSTSYESYIAVYNELKGAYNELWEDASQQRFGRAFGALPDGDKALIRREIPMVISESEPVDFVGGRTGG